MSIRHKIVIGFLCPITLLLAVAFVIYSSTKGLIDATKWVEHTHKVIADAHVLEKMMIDMETGERGFLITGKEEFLEPFHEARKTWNTHIDTMKITVSDNPAQVELLQEIDKLAQRWKIEAADPEIEQRRKVKPQDVSLNFIQNILRKGKGKAVIDEIRTKVEHLGQLLSVSHARESENKLAQIMKDIVDQETGERGFLITGDESFLEPYYQGKNNFSRHISELRTLVFSTPEKAKVNKLIEEIKNLQKSWLETSAEPEIRSKGNLKKPEQNKPELNSLLVNNQGKGILGELTEKIKYLEGIFLTSGNDPAQYQITQLAKSIGDQVTGQRGFLLTGDERFLEPYHQGKSNFESIIGELENIANDLLNQEELIAHINTIERLVESWHHDSADNEIQTRRELNENETNKATWATDHIKIVDNSYQKLLVLINKLEQNSTDTKFVEGIHNASVLGNHIRDTKLSLYNILLHSNHQNTQFPSAETSKFNRFVSQLQLLVEQSNTAARPQFRELLSQISDEGNLWFQGLAKLITSSTLTTQQNTATIVQIQDIIKSGTGKSILDDLRDKLDSVNQKYLRSNQLEASLLVIKASKYMVDQESGQRGFLITGESSFLEPFHAGRKNFRESISKLHNITSLHYDKESVQSRLIKLKTHLNFWHKNAVASSISKKQDQLNGKASQDEVEELVRSRLGKQTIDAIRRIVDDTTRDFLRSKNSRQAKLLMDVLRSVVIQETGLRSYLLTGKTEFLDLLNLEQTVAKQTLDILSQSVKNSYDKNEVQTQIANISETAELWLTQAGLPEIALREDINQSGGTMNDVTALIEKETGKRLIEAVRIKIQTFINVEKQLIEERIIKADKAAQDTLFTVLAGSFSAILLAIFSSFALTRTILPSLSALLSATRKVSEGDYGVQISLEQKDEIGELSQEFNAMTLALKKSTDEMLAAKVETDQHAKQLERQNEEIENSNNELLKIQQELQSQAQALEQSSRIKSEFLASMSHEIRTPMNGVLGMLNLLQKEILTDDQHHKIKLAHSSAQSLLTLINDILDFSKIEANKLDIEILDFDLVALLADFSEASAVKAHDKNLEFILDVRGVENRFVKGDPGRVRQILNNLVGNAIKFTSQGEVVVRASLSTVKNNQYTFKCDVIDSGIGIAEEKIDQIFNSFTQEDASTTRRFGGTGLGLAIAKQLCELMGGSINVTSKINRGSTFSFNIQLEVSQQQEEIPEANFNGVRTLIVDDNYTNREVLQGQLELWGCQVNTVDSAKAAMELLNNTPYYNLFELMFVDFQMPGTNGGDLAKEIRKEPKFNGIKLVMMTSMVEHGDAERFKNMGFSAYFPKPITFDYLYDALALLLKRNNDVNSDLPILTQHNVQSLKAKQLPEIQAKFKPGARILIVDDNQINQEVVAGLIEDFELVGAYANNGFEAIEALREAPDSMPFELVFMDCQMPEMDGFAATKAIRSGKAGNKYKNISIIAMTANAMKGDKERCLKSGMNDYLSKPIQEDKVIDILNRYLIPADGDAHGDLICLPEDLETPPAESTKNATDIWDEEAFLKRIRGRHDRALRLISSFENHIPEELSSLKRAIDKQELEDIALHAHAIKGVASNLSANELAELMGLVESAGMEKDLDRVEDLASDFDVIFNRLSQKLGEGRRRFSS